MVYKYSTRQLTSRLINLLKDHKYHILAAIIMVIISVILSVYAPKLIGKMINGLMKYALDLSKTPTKATYEDIILIIILFAASYLIRIPSNRIMSKTSENVIKKLRNQLYEKLSHIDIDESKSDGVLMSRLNSDIANLKSFISNTIILFI